MEGNMLTSCWINIFFLLTLTHFHALLRAEHVSKRKNEVHIPDHHQTGGPANPRPVSVRCLPESWEVVIQADLFHTGIMVDGRHLRLGVEQLTGPACRAVPSGPAQFTIQAPLLDCGTMKLPPTEGKITYSNVLVYSPEPSSDGLLRLDGATIPVKCHYSKYYSAQTQSLSPKWTPLVLRTRAESRIDFSLRLMTGDWQYERKSLTFYVGEPIHVEVSSMLGNHKPLRVFVDHCVATATPDPEAALRYDFIDHHGCLADAYLTNSSAHFLSRTQGHRIQFKLDAFTFHQENTKQIYIFCHLTAVPSMMNVKSRHRACSLIDNRWRSADGDDEDCKSCAIPYPLKEPPTRAFSSVHLSVKEPLSSRGLSRGNGQQPATYMHVRQEPPQNVHTAPQPSAGFTREGENRKGTLRLGPLIILHNPKASDVSRQRAQTARGIMRR